VRSTSACADAANAPATSAPATATTIDRKSDGRPTDPASPESRWSIVRPFLRIRSKTTTNDQNRQNSAARSGLSNASRNECCGGPSRPGIAPAAALAAPARSPCPAWPKRKCASEAAWWAQRSLAEAGAVGAPHLRRAVRAQAVVTSAASGALFGSRFRRSIGLLCHLRQASADARHGCRASVWGYWPEPGPAPLARAESHAVPLRVKAEGSPPPSRSRQAALVIEDQRATTGGSPDEVSLAKRRHPVWMSSTGAA
jgi:hypothetical protein